MFMGAYSRKYKEREKEKRLMRRDLLRQGLSDHCDVARRASRETARRQRMLDEKKRSDEEAELRRREEVLEQRRQQQREGMSMMRSHKRNHSGKKPVNRNSKQQDIDVEFYGKAGVCKSLTHGMTKLNGVRIVQGSRVEMTSRPWKTSHTAFGVDNTSRAVSNNKSMQVDMQANRDSLEGTPTSPEDENRAGLCSMNSDVRDVASHLVGNGFTATFVRSHVSGHRGVQSSDLALEDVALDDVVEGNGRDAALTLRVGDEGKGVRDSEVNVSMDSIEGEDVDMNDISLDERLELNVRERDKQDAHEDHTSDTRGEEVVACDYGDSGLSVSASGHAIANQQRPFYLWKKTSHKKPPSCPIELQSNDVYKRDANALKACQYERQDTDTRNAHVTSASSSSSLSDSLDYRIQQESKPHVATSIGNRKLVIKDEISSSQSVGRETEETRIKSHDEMGVKQVQIADTSERSQGKQEHLFMSSVVMNTPAASTVQAALSQYVAGQPSETVNHISSNSHRNSLNIETHSGHTRTHDSRLDTSNTHPLVAIATKLDHVERQGAGYQLREVSSEQKLTGILKKPNKERPSSASKADTLRSSCDKATADIMKKTVRFADPQHNTRTSSSDDYLHVSSVKFRKKRIASAPAISRTARQHDTEHAAVQHEALSVASLARKASQNRQKAVKRYSKVMAGHTTTRRVWEPKVVIKSESSSGDAAHVHEEGCAHDEGSRDEAKGGHDQLDVDQLDVDVGPSISLEKTPTDDEINQLWNTVRSRLQHESSYDTLKGLISSKLISETTRCSTVPSTFDTNDTVAVQSTKHTNNYHVRNRSQLTNRPTMAARVIAARDVPQDATKQLHAAISQPQSPIATSQSVSHLPPESGFMETSLYPDSHQSVMSRPPVYVRHYQQQAEMALARGSMRMPVTSGRSNGLPSNGKDGRAGGSDRVVTRDGQNQAVASSGKKPMTVLSIEEMQVLRSLERLNTKLDEKKAVLQSAHNAVGGATMTVKTIQPQQRQKTSSTTGAPYRAAVRSRSLSDMPKTRVRRNPQAVAAAAIAAAQSRNSRTQPHVPIHRQAYYNM